jgi:hypothetical protein
LLRRLAALGNKHLKKIWNNARNKAFFNAQAASKTRGTNTVRPTMLGAK